MRLIDAGTLKEKIKSRFQTEPTWNFSGLRIAEHEIEQMPTVDAIPVEWIEETMKLAETVGAKEYAEHLEVLLADWIERKEE